MCTRAPCIKTTSANPPLWRSFLEQGTLSCQFSMARYCKARELPLLYSHILRLCPALSKAAQPENTTHVRATAHLLRDGPRSVLPVCCIMWNIVTRTGRAAKTAISPHGSIHSFYGFLDGLVPPFGIEHNFCWVCTQYHVVLHLHNLTCYWRDSGAQACF